MQLHRALSAAAQPDRTVFKLADHLHSTLTACADLDRCLPLDGSEESVGLALRTELAAITHLLQARTCAGDVMQTDPRLAECAELFIAGTQALEYSSVMPANEYMLGRRLPVSAAIRFATHMLEAVASVYPRPVPADAITGVPEAEAA